MISGPPALELAGLTCHHICLPFLRPFFVCFSIFVERRIHLRPSSSSPSLRLAFSATGADLFIDIRGEVNGIAGRYGRPFDLCHVTPLAVNGATLKSGRGNV